MICHGRSWLREEDGGAVLETALLLPLLLLLIIGAMQISVLLFGYCSASFAARNAVRFASLHSSTSLVPATAASMQASITPYMWMGTQSAAPTITPSWPSGNIVGYPVSVSASVTYNVVLPFMTRRSVTLTCVAQRSIVR